jgi:prephenate dehydrogenase
VTGASSMVALPEGAKGPFTGEEGGGSEGGLADDSGFRLGRVAIVGTGQVGTSLGIGLRSAGASAGVDGVVLFDRDLDVARESLARGAGDRVARSTAQALRADSLILAVPVPDILGFLQEHGRDLRPDSLVIDTGSAKRQVVRTMRASVPESVHAIGGHPVAGTEQPGPTGARPDRLRGAAFVLTPVRDDPEALARGRLLAEAVGARPVEMDAEAHDETVAVASHLPHLLAFVLAGTAAEAEASGEPVAGLAASGFAGAVRLAASDPEMVAGFLAANADAVLAAATRFEVHLERLLAAMDAGPQQLALLLAKAALRAAP